VLVDAMRGEVFHAPYGRDGERWRREAEIAVTSWRKLAARPIPGPLTGPGLAGIGVEDWRAERLPSECWSPRAGQVALIGEREAEAGLVADLWTLQPLYIRKSAAEERMERTVPSP
jgi:hypothetical protein